MTPDPIRWSRLFPELRAFDGPDARRAAWQNAQWTCVGSDRADLKCLAIMGIVGVVCLPAHWLLEHLLSQRPGTMSVSAAIASASYFATVVAAGVTSYQIRIRRPVRRHLRRLLIARGSPLCAFCGYQLRGQREPRCPECGREFDPRLITEPPPAE